MDRQAQFRARQALIFQVAEQLLLENGEAGMTLDALAAELYLAKGRYINISKVKMNYICCSLFVMKRMLLEMIKDTDKAFPEHLAFFMLHHLHHPELTVLFHQIEERLSTTGVGIQHLFSELYQVRKQRLRLIIRMTERYLESIQSSMPVRDYLASIWSLTHGAAAILNSSFYQRYLGSRDTCGLLILIKPWPYQNKCMRLLNPLKGCL